MGFPCRKCGTSNPTSNQYCKQCGAVLRVSTEVVRAQRAPVSPVDTRFKFRYVLIGALVMLGLSAAAVGLALLCGVRNGVSEAGIVGGLMMFTLSVGTIFVVSFGLSGALLSLFADRAVGRESFVAAVLVIAALGVIGSTVVFDLLITAGVLLLPTAFAAWIGARVKRAR